MSLGAGAAAGRKRGPNASWGSDPGGGRERPAALCVRSRVASPFSERGPCSTSPAAPRLRGDARTASGAGRRRDDARCAESAAEAAT